MEQPNKQSQFPGRKKPESFTLGSVFETQADILARRLQNNVKPIQNLPPVQSSESAQEVFDIIDAEIVEDHTIEPAIVAIENHIQQPTSILDASESDMAEIVAQTALEMEVRKKAEAESDAGEIESLRAEIQKLSDSKEVLERYLHTLESAIEINDEQLTSSSDRQNMIKVIEKIRATDFDILEKMSKVQYIINKSKGMYKEETDLGLTAYYDIVMTGRDTTDPEVINIIVEMIKQDIKYKSNGRREIFTIGVIYTGVMYSLPEMVENIITNPSVTLEQTIELVKSVGDDIKPSIIVKFLKFSPLLNSLDSEIQINKNFLDATKDRNYMARVAPIMREFIDNLSYHEKQKVIAEMSWSDLDNQRATYLNSVLESIKNEKDPDKQGVLDRLKQTWQLGRPKS